MTEKERWEAAAALLAAAKALEENADRMEEELREATRG